MPKPIEVFTVILTTEHGDDVKTLKTHNKALQVAGKMIEETLKELEDEIDEDEDGVASLVALRNHLSEKRFVEAIDIYNKLHEDHFSTADAHELRIKSTILE